MYLARPHPQKELTDPKGAEHSDTFPQQSIWSFRALGKPSSPSQRPEVRADTFYLWVPVSFPKNPSPFPSRDEEYQSHYGRLSRIPSDEAYTLNYITPRFALQSPFYLIIS